MLPLGRQRRHVRLTLTAPTVGDVVRVIELTKDRPYSFSVDAVKVQVYDDGTLSAQVPPGRNNPTPRLTARLLLGKDGVVLDGVIQEAGAGGVMMFSFGLLALFFAWMTVGAGGVIPVTVFLGAATVVFGVMACGMARGRPSAFDLDCRILLDNLCERLPVTQE